MQIKFQDEKEQGVVIPFLEYLIAELPPAENSTVKSILNKALETSTIGNGGK